MFAFSGAENSASPSSPIRALCDFLVDAPGSPVRKCTPAGGDIDSVIDVRAIFQQFFLGISESDRAALA